GRGACPLSLWERAGVRAWLATGQEDDALTRLAPSALRRPLPEGEARYPSPWRGRVGQRGKPSGTQNCGVLVSQKAVGWSAAVSPSALSNALAPRPSSNF